MDSQTVGTVQTTWQAVEGIADQAAALFYDNLFAADPALRPLFKADMAEQRRKLMQMIGLAVGQLDDLDALVPALQALARRHATYGVKEEHYDTVGAALLQTLAQGLGPAFTPPVRAAWAEVYGLMAGVMITAARPPA